MSDYVHTSIGAGYNSSSNLNTEFSGIESAIATKLDADGGFLTADIDANSKKILNLPDGTQAGDSVNYGQLVNRAAFQAGEEKYYDTVALWQADTTTATGDVAVIKDRANGIFDVITGTGTANTWNIVAHSTLSLSIELRDSEIITIKKFGAVGDDSTDNAGPLQATIDNSTTSVLVGQGVFFSDTKLTASASIMIKGISKESSVLKGPTNTGTTTGTTLLIDDADDVEIRDLTIDGNRQVSETKTSGADRITLNIVGNVAGNPIKRVLIENVRITNTAYHGIAIEHVDELIINNLWIDDCYGNGLVVSGVNNVNINNINGIDIGNLQAQNFRSGSVLIINGRSATTQATLNVTVDGIVCENTTDSAVYLGDSTTLGSGSATVNNVVINNSGKDGIKCENGFSNTSFSNVRIDKCANTSVRFQSTTGRHTLTNAIITNGGFNAIGTDYTGGTGVSESLQLNPVGLYIQAPDVTITNVIVDSVIDAPDDNGFGDCIYARESDRLHISNTILKNSDTRGIRIEGCSDFNISATVRDCGLNGIGTTAGVTVGAYTATNSNGTLQLNSKDEQGTKTMDYAFRVFASQGPVYLKNIIGLDTDHATGSYTVDSSADVRFMNGNDFGDTSQPALTFTSADATPSVKGYKVFKTNGTTAITDFDDGQIGDTIKILAQANITITDGAPIILNGSVDFTMTPTDTLTLTMYNDQIWSEDARSVN